MFVVNSSQMKTRLTLYFNMFKIQAALIAYLYKDATDFIYRSSRSKASHLSRGKKSNLIRITWVTSYWKSLKSPCRFNSIQLGTSIQSAFYYVPLNKLS